jgi:hypothetical protein
MAGNVWQLCQDYTRDPPNDTYSRVSPAVDPLSSGKTSRRVMRGGSWFSSGCTSAHRAPTYIGFFCSDIGFRMVVECGSSIGGDAPDSSKADTLNGTFNFPAGGSKNTALKIVLTPTATANEYKAVYYFHFLGKDRIFPGTFKRNPQTGDVSGTAISPEPGNRTFLFRGKSADGVLNCQHYETTGLRQPGGKEEYTGTMTLKWETSIR